MNLVKLKQQKKIFLRELNAVPTLPLPIAIVSQATKGMGKPTTPLNKFDPTKYILTGD